MSLTPEERKEFSDLKHIRCNRGFLLPVEKQRYDELFHKNAQAFVSKMKQIEETNRLIMSN
jgi:hypothetical protein